MLLSGGVQCAPGCRSRGRQPGISPQPRLALEVQAMTETGRHVRSCLQHVAQPWPASAPYGGAAWLDGWGVHRRAWQHVLGDLMQPVVVEIGAWMGRTTRHLLESGLAGHVVAIDLWQARGYWSDRLQQAGLAHRDPLLQFQANCWKYREHITCVRSESVAGVVSCQSLRPAVAYIDADHSRDAVQRDLDVVMAVWPECRICGDDWERKDSPPCTGVADALDDLMAEDPRLSLWRDGRFWALRGWPQ